ncbi:fimbrial biogenesis outer membrane usher protein [Salmonella enterica]|nr:fimbrial biogenesis outer membrane usher protein [Salmonella enterica]
MTQTLRHLLSQSPHLSLVTLVLLSCGFRSAQAEMYYDVKALHLSPENRARTDLSLLSRTDIQMPGDYRVLVKVNKSRAGEHTLHFVICDNTHLCPQLTPALLKQLGVKISVFPALQSKMPDTPLRHIGDYIRGAESDFDFDKRELKLSIPQAALDTRVRGDIPPDRWDSGLPMLFSSGSASGSEIKNILSGQETSSQYLNLRSGINLGEWRIRNYSYYARIRHQHSGWNSMQTWAERDIRQLRSRFVAGETSTPGLIYDSFNFRGISLASRTEMQPDSQQGYAPEVRGVAVTNATVEIRQNGNLLYQTFVAPGPFIINDLYATTTSGDLVITVKEENGTVRTFTQAFASPPVSVRKDALRYSLSVGEFGSRYYNDNSCAINQRFAQAELIFGLFSGTSFYGGGIAATHYRSAMAGVGQSMGVLGAISADYTQASSDLSDGRTRKGQSLQLKYSKMIDTTGTSMTLAGYRYASDGFYSFEEASNGYHEGARASQYRLKNKFQLTLSQNIGWLGSVALSAYQSSYWDVRTPKNRSVTGSWSQTFYGVSVTLNQSQSKIWKTGRTNNITSISISLPLGDWLSPSGVNNLRLDNGWSRSDSGGLSMTTTLSGTNLADNSLSWSVSQARSKGNNSRADSTAVSGSYRGSRATYGLGFSDYYGQQQTVNWSVRGAVVVHPYGVTLSRQLSEGAGYALVRAPGASGVRISNHTGLVTDRRGFVIVPSLSAYRDNTLSLDTSSLADDVDVVDAIRHGIPEKEALIMADYRTSIGYRAFLTLTNKGTTLPLGVTVTSGEATGLTNERGQVWLTGVQDNARIIASLPGGRVCRSIFRSDEVQMKNGIAMGSLQCKV